MGGDETVSIKKGRGIGPALGDSFVNVMRLYASVVLAGLRRTAEMSRQGMGALMPSDTLHFQCLHMQGYFLLL